MKHQSNRRQALATLSTTVAAGATALWTRPVVKSVALPVHAQSTCGCLQVDTFESEDYRRDGPFSGQLLIFNSIDCSGDPARSLNVVEAENAAQALQRYNEEFGSCGDNPGNMGVVNEYTCIQLWFCNT